MLVGPTCLPTGLRRSTVPARVSESLKLELKKQPDLLEASFAVAQTLAKACGVLLQVTWNSVELHTKHSARKHRPP